MSVVIEPSEIDQFMDAYRDGIIDEDSARKLAKEIERGGQSTQKIIEEFEFNGLISQALDNMTKENFVRNFLERMYAEKTSGEFTAVVASKTADEQPKIIPQSSVVRLVKDLLFSHQQTSSDASTGTAVSLKPRAFIVIIAVVCVLAALWQIPNLFKGPTLSLAEFTQGVVISRDEEGMNPELNMTLRGMDKISVPSDGNARIYFDDSSWLRLKSSARVVLMPETITNGPVELGDGKSIMVQFGEVELDIKPQGKRDLFQVISQSAIAETSEAHFKISVTSNSMRLEVHKGIVNLIRLRDGKILEVSAGQSVVTNENTEFKAIYMKKANAIPNKTPSKEK
ncbi:FecR domain-containing protein [bacterium AH-315-E10]|nr:FecR domain-containing protein [bacterium AH-315-E10]